MNPVAIGFHVVVGQLFKESRGGVRPEGKPSIRITRNPPALAAHEVSVWVNLQLPASLFLRPSLSAAIRVNDSQAPAVITPEVMSNIAQVVQDRLGIVMDVRAAEVQP